MTIQLPSQSERRQIREDYEKTVLSVKNEVSKIFVDSIKSAISAGNFYCKVEISNLEILNNLQWTDSLNLLRELEQEIDSNPDYETFIYNKSHHVLTSPAQLSVYIFFPEKNEEQMIEWICEGCEKSLIESHHSKVFSLYELYDIQKLSALPRKRVRRIVDRLKKEYGFEVSYQETDNYFCVSGGASKKSSFSFYKTYQLT